MKLRTGFVSNSSSSSFVVYGTSFDDASDFIKLVIKNDDKLKAKIEKHVKEQYGESGEDGEPATLEDIIEDDYYEILEIILEDIGMEYTTPEDGGVMIGVSPFDIKDDETGAQFKARVKAEIEKIVGKKVKCEAIEETIYS